MAVTFSSADLRQLEAAQTALLSPLDHPAPGAWADALIGALIPLLRPENVVFLVAEAGGRPLVRTARVSFSEVETCVARYGQTDLNRKWFGQLACRTATSSDLWAAEPDGRRTYLQSETFNDFYRPLGALATGYMAVDVNRGPFGRALLHLSAGRWDHPLDSDLTRAALGLLWPAFEGSIHMIGRFGAARASLLSLLDRAGGAVLVADVDGQTVHQTPPLVAMLASDPERDRVTDAARLLAKAAGRPGRPAQTSGWRAVSAEVTTVGGRYALRATRLKALGEAEWGRPLLLIAINRTERAALSDGEARARFRLTAQETRVALLLAERRTNAEVAAALCISPKTARRHTERVLDKLGVGRRTEVASALSWSPPGGP